MLFSFNRMQNCVKTISRVKIGLNQSFAVYQKIYILKFVVYVATSPETAWLVQRCCLPLYSVMCAYSVRGSFWKSNFSNNESSLYFYNTEWKSITLSLQHIFIVYFLINKFWFNLTFHFGNKQGSWFLLIISNSTKKYWSKCMY